MGETEQQPENYNVEDWTPTNAVQLSSSQQHYSSLLISEPGIQDRNLTELFEDAAEFGHNISVELNLAHLTGSSTEKSQFIHPVVSTEHSIERDMHQESSYNAAQFVTSIGLSDMWTMDKAQVPVAPELPSMDWTQNLQSQQATVVDTYEDFNQLQSPPLVTPLGGCKHKLSSQEAHAQTTFVHEDRPRKRAKGRKCRKCGITGCKGVGGAKWCFNPCADCQRLDCQGRDASYSDVPCGGRSMFIQGSSQ